MSGPAGTGGVPDAPLGYVPPGVPGVAAGSPNPNIRARTVIVSGPTGMPVGVFVYAPGTTPGLGNPPVVAITNQTADPFGNSVVPATAVSPAEFIVLGSGGSFAQLAVQAGVAALIMGTGDASEVLAGTIGAFILGAGSTRQLGVNMVGNALSGATAAIGQIELLTSSADGGVTAPATINLIVAGQTVLQCLAVSTGNSTQQVSVPSGTQLSVAAGGGPFIAGEGHHSVGLAGGLSGTMRVKKRPDNTVEFQALISWSTTSATTFTCGSLPDSTYYPTVVNPSGSLFAELTSNTVPAAGSTVPRVLIPTSGAIQVLVPASSGGGNGSCTIIYPTN